MVRRREAGTSRCLFAPTTCRLSKPRRRRHASLLAVFHACERMQGHEVREGHSAIEGSRNGSTGSAIRAQFLAAANNHTSNPANSQTVKRKASPESPGFSGRLRSVAESLGIADNAPSEADRRRPLDFPAAPLVFVSFGKSCKSGRAAISHAKIVATRAHRSPLCCRVPVGVLCFA